MANIRRSADYQGVLDVLTPLNIPHVIEYGGKHAKVRFVVNGRPACVVVSVSPSDRNVRKAAACNTIRVLRERGVKI